MAVNYLTIFEQSTSWIDVSFEDIDGSAATPSALEYCLDCMSTGTLILDWTVVAGPTATTRITITAAQNVIHDATKDEELHRLTVKATFGVDGQSTAEYKFLVQNLDQVT